MHLELNAQQLEKTPLPSTQYLQNRTLLRQKTGVKMLMVSNQNATELEITDQNEKKKRKKSLIKI
jgi:hypothetical protein